jgi:CheY-like chemotaxis protein
MLDNLSNRKMLAMALRNTFTCEMAENGKVACEMVRSQPDKFSIVFMDNIMPVMTGIEATAEIRKLGFDKLIMGLTGNSLEEDTIAFLDAGADIVLAKPLRRPQIDSIMSYTRKNGFDSGGSRWKLQLNDEGLCRYYLQKQNAGASLLETIASTTMSMSSSNVLPRLRSIDRVASSIHKDPGARDDFVLVSNHDSNFETSKTFRSAGAAIDNDE